MAPARLRILQVGLGGWGRNWAASIIPEVATVDLAGQVDPDPAALQLVTGDTPRFTSLNAALAAADVDAVLVTAGVAGHVPVVQDALEAGKHVLVEKPFAPTVKEAAALVERAAAADLTLMVSQNYRYQAAPRAVRKLVERGDLGALHHVDLEFRRRSVYVPGKPRPHHAYAHPLLDDMSIHHFDLLRYITGESPTSVFIQAWNPSGSGFAGPPAASGVMTFSSGVNVSYRGSWVSSLPETPWAGEWKMEFEKGDIVWGKEDENDVIVSIDSESRRVQPEPLQLTDRRGTLAEFADAVRTGRVPECSGADNLGSLALRSAAIDSADRHTLVTLR